MVVIVATNITKGLVFNLDVGLLGILMLGIFSLQLLLYWMWIKIGRRLASSLATPPKIRPWRVDTQTIAIGLIMLMPYLLALSAVTGIEQSQRKAHTFCRQAIIGDSIAGLQDKAAGMGLMFRSNPAKTDPSGLQHRASIEVFPDLMFAQPQGCFIEHDDGKIVWKGRLVTASHWGLDWKQTVKD